MITVWAGNANPSFAKNLATALGYLECSAQVKQFPDGESHIDIPAMIPPHNMMILVQSLSRPANHYVMELLLMADAAHRAGYATIVALIPYFAYARQDKSQSFLIKTIADILENSAIKKIITLDAHSAALQHCFSIPFQELHPTELFAADIQTKYAYHKNDLMIIAPDLGSIPRAERLSNALNLPYKVINKKEIYSSEMNSKPPLLPNLEGYTCIIIDDIVDSGKTLCHTIQQLKTLGAVSIIAYVTHGLFSVDALARLLSTEIQEIIITDSVAASTAVLNCHQIRILSIVPLFAQAIKSPCL